MHSFSNPWPHGIHFSPRAWAPLSFLDNAFRACTVYVDRVLPPPCSAPSVYDEPAESYFQHRIGAISQRRSRRRSKDLSTAASCRTESSIRLPAPLAPPPRIR